MPRRTRETTTAARWPVDGRHRTGSRLHPSKPYGPLSPPRVRHKRGGCRQAWPGRILLSL